MKLGLVLEGGASRGYFSCGVLDALLEENIIADYIIGSSAGIANGVSYASGQIGRNLQIAKEYLNDKRYMGVRHMLNPKNKSYYNLDFVFDSISNEHIPFDYEAFENFKGSVVAAVTNVDTGEAEYIEVPRKDKKGIVLRASCALPLLFPMITINNKKYMDGGIVSPIPVDEAIRSGCDKNIVILTRERNYHKEVEKPLILAAKLYKKYPNFSKILLKRSEIYNNNLLHVKKLESEGKIFVIAPKSMKNFKRTESNPEKLEQIYNDGYNITKDILPNLLKYLNS